MGAAWRHNDAVRTGIIFRLLCAVTVAFVLAGATFAAPKINVNVKDGETISGQFKFRVTVESDELITQVEFSVGDDLRDTDSSTPYEFSLDTLAESDGDLTVTFAAYTESGASTKKTVKLKVDNGLGKGAEYHVQKANEALAVSKWDEALASGRVALKITPGYVPARIAMARANLGKGVLDAAQKFAEDAVAAEPNNAQALQILAAVNLQKAFNIVNRGTDRAAVLATIKSATTAAIEAQRKVLENAVDAFGKVDDSNRMAYVDACIRASRFSRALEQLGPLFQKQYRDSAIANKYVFTLMRANRTKEAGQAMAQHKKYGTLDGYGYALYAILLDEQGKSQEAQDAEREAILGDGENLGVRTAQAYLALRRLKTDVLNKLAQDLAKDESQRPEVTYYLATVRFKLDDFEDSRKWFERTLLTDPTLYDMYIERANQAIGLAISGRLTDTKDVEYQYDVAKVFFEAALVAKPESFEGLTGMAIVSLLQKKVDDAVRFARAAVAAGPEYAAAHYALAAMLNAKGKALTSTRTTANQAQLDVEIAKINAESLKEAETAGKLDKANLEGRSVPDIVVCWRYFWRYGRTPLITAP